MTESNAQHDQAIEILQACCLRLLKSLFQSHSKGNPWNPGVCSLSPSASMLRGICQERRRKGAPESWPSYAQCGACATAGSAPGRTQVTLLTPVACSQQLKRCNIARY